MSLSDTEFKTYLITGGAGFIGSHLTEALLNRGNSVKVIDDLSTGRFDNIAPLRDNPNFHFTESNILERDIISPLFEGVEVVIHLAAAVGVMLIVEKPVHTIETNIMGTEAVLKAALKNNCRVLIASSSEVYGKGNNIPFDEEDDVLLGPTSKSRWSYAASKMVDEFLGMAYTNEFGLEVVSFRLFNTIGLRQTGQYGMVIPRFIRSALKGEPITVYGDGEQSRCFCEVRDVVEALIKLATHPDAPGGVYNIGSSEEISILELARKIKNITGSASEIVKIPYENAYAPGFEDLKRRVPDLSRIKKLLGWKPRTPLETSLREIAEYERKKISNI